MKQYTFKGFADILVTSTQFNNQKTRDKKLLLLDRCNWLISSIIKLHIKLNEPYGKYLNLQSQILKKVNRCTHRCKQRNKKGTAFQQSPL